MSPAIAAADRPNLCFAAPHLGEYSEVWLWRQIVGLRRLKPHVLTWKWMNEEAYPLKGIPVRLLPFHPRPIEQNGFRRWVYRAWRLPTLNFYGSFGTERRIIEEQLKNTRAEVILCQTGYMALKLLPVARKVGIPLAAHFHGVDLSAGLRNRWYRWSLLHEMSRFAAVIVVGSHQERWMIDHGIDRGKIHLIPCGVPVKLFSPAGNRPSERVRFLAVSRLVEKKGVEYTIRAFARLHERIPGVELNIVGDGPLRESLEGLARNLGVAEQVTFHGACEQKEVMEFLSRADVFVQHSVIPADGAMEGSPVAIAEASASGLPVVVTRDCGGTEDLVVHGVTGFLVRQRDVEEMAKYMVQLAEDAGLRARLGAAGREHMSNEFDTEKQIAKLETVLLSLVGGGAPPLRVDQVPTARGRL